MSPPSPSRRARTSSRVTTRELLQTDSGSSSVEETTYLVELLNLSANSPSREGQCFANSSKVRRPSRSASEPIVSSSLNLSPSSPRSNRNAQPPRSRLSDPPGSSKTPSSVTNSVTTTRAILASFVSSLGGRTAGVRATHRPLGGHRTLDRRGRVEQPLEEPAVAADLDSVPAPLREQVVEVRGRRLEDDVGILRWTGDGLTVDERPDLVADPELEGAVGSDGREERVQRVRKPAPHELVFLARGGQRLQAPARELAHDRPQRRPVRGQLVHLRRCRRRQPPLREDARGLEILQPRGEDIRADAGQRVGEVRVALRALQELADDQQRPALADPLERVGDRAVLLVVLGHARSVAPPLAGRKGILAF